MYIYIVHICILFDVEYRHLASGTLPVTFTNLSTRPSCSASPTRGSTTKSYPQATQVQCVAVCRNVLQCVAV